MNGDASSSVAIVAPEGACGWECGRTRSEHLCPCGCGHNYDDAVRNIMGGVVALNWFQAAANIDDHPDIPCRW